MRIGQESYRDTCKAVSVLPAEHRKIMGEVKPETAAWPLAKLLVSSPASVVVGQYHRSDRRVHFKQPRPWRVRNKEMLTRAVPESAIISAVRGFASFLRSQRLPYAVWQSKPAGNRQDGSAVEVCNFTVGLVHVDGERAKLSRYKGKGAEPGS